VSSRLRGVNEIAVTGVVTTFSGRSSFYRLARFQAGERVCRLTRRRRTVRAFAAWTRRRAGGGNMESRAFSWYIVAQGDRAMTNTIVRARIDERVKEEAATVLAAMGLTASEALPFEPESAGWGLRS
jgi:hypothetical protein